MTDTFLTADTGGSKTHICLYNKDGTFIKEAFTAGFGTVADSAEDIPELSSFLKDFSADCKVNCAVVNLGGKNKNQIEFVFKKALGTNKVSVMRESEGDASAALCRMYGSDAVLMAGTGSIAMVPVGDSTVISGGWGANIGDKGSGYDIGLTAVRTALEEIDGILPLSGFTRKITGLSKAPGVMTAKEYCELRDKVRANIFPIERQHIASFTKLLYECAENGDYVACRIFEKAGSDLADTVIAAAKKAGKELKSIVVTGGLVNCSQLWKQSFEDSILKHYKTEKIHYLVNGISSALSYIALETLKGEQKCFQKDL